MKADWNDRRMDTLIAEHVFRVACVHDQQPVPEAVLLSEARAEFKREYGAEPPPKWRPLARPKDCHCSTLRAETMKPDSGYWCVKCGRRDDLEYLPRYSHFLDAAWEVIEKLSPTHPFELVDVGSFNPGTTFERWEARFGDDVSASADTVALAICRAALAVVGVEVPA